jgi:hypothetical protein
MIQKKLKKKTGEINATKFLKLFKWKGNDNRVREFMEESAIRYKWIIYWYIGIFSSANLEFNVILKGMCYDQLNFENEHTTTD